MRTKNFSAALLSLSVLGACQNSIVDRIGISPPPGGRGLIVADEPQAVLVARQVLEQGGNAADAAAALALALSVTYQSAAGLGGAGLCVVYSKETTKFDLLDFLPIHATGHLEEARWQVSVPALPRGVFTLHAKYGALPWPTVVVRAENLARFGADVSRSFSHHLQFSSAGLANDPKALQTFSTGRRSLLREGDRFANVELAATLASLRTRQPGDFYSGDLSELIHESAQYGGFSLSGEDLRSYVPTWEEVREVSLSGVRVAHAGYLYDENEFEIDLISNTSYGPQSRSSGAASTGFIVADSSGNIVTCALTMGAPFGTGVLVEGAGFLAASAPNLRTIRTQPLLSVIGIDQSSGLPRFAVAGGGADVVGKAVSIIQKGLEGATHVADLYPLTQSSIRPDEDSLVNALMCEGRAARFASECNVFADPVGHGYAITSNGDPRS